MLKSIIIIIVVIGILYFLVTQSQGNIQQKVASGGNYMGMISTTPNITNSVVASSTTSNTTNSTAIVASATIPIATTTAPIAMPVTVQYPRGIQLGLEKTTKTNMGTFTTPVALIGSIVASYQGSRYNSVWGGPFVRNTPSETTWAEKNDRNDLEHVWIRFQKDVPIDEVFIENRTDCCQDYMVGCTLVLRNSVLQNVWSQDIKESKASYLWTISPSGATTLTTVA